VKPAFRKNPNIAALEGWPIGQRLRVTEDAVDRQPDLDEGRVGEITAIGRRRGDEPGMYAVAVLWDDNVGEVGIICEAALGWCERVS
jgi:hypothetical protein